MDILPDHKNAKQTKCRFGPRNKIDYNFRAWRSSKFPMESLYLIFFALALLLLKNDQPDFFFQKINIFIYVYERIFR